MKEIWKDIEGYEGSYQVSNFGRIKSIKFETQRILKQRLSGCENMCVVINSGTAFCLRMGTIFHHI